MSNLTAKVSCFARAYHYLNNSAHVFSDDMAVKILGDDYNYIAESMKNGISYFLPNFEGTLEEGLQIIVDNQLSPSVLGRSAFCETMLNTERRKGCKQYLIFASGYDTYAIRNYSDGMNVFELDLPEMLEDKSNRLEKASLVSNSIYVPCDLSDDEWKMQLTESGFNNMDKTFGSLLGISYYLNVTEWSKLIESISQLMTEGSVICFDYPSKEESRETTINSSLAREAGEEMKSQYSFSDMESVLGESGFSISKFLDATSMTEKYFSEFNRVTAKNLKAPDGVCYILARKIGSSRKFVG